MRSEIHRFLIKITLVSTALVVVGFVVFKWVFAGYYLPVYWWALLFFYGFTLFVHFWQANTARKDLAKFSRLNMIVTFLKLMVYAGFVVVYLIIGTENTIAFVLVIMLLYLAFTITEVTSLTRFTRSLNKKPEK